MKRTITFITFIFFVCINLSAGTPHTVIWEVNIDGVGHPETIEFEAWIETRPDEILTEESMGSWYNPANGYALCNVGNFTTEWSQGEIIYIRNDWLMEPIDTIGESYGLITDDGYDFFGEMILFIQSMQYCKFSSEPHLGFKPLDVQFTDLSYNPWFWEWDFQNDGIIDSYDQNPIYTYTQVGIFDVKLTISGSRHYIITNNVHVDNILPPSNVSAEISNNDIILSWTEVDTTALGNPIQIDNYNIYSSSNPYEDFELLDSTPDVTYIHTGILNIAEKKFYQVKSVLDTRK